MLNSCFIIPLLIYHFHANNFTSETDFWTLSGYFHKELNYFVNLPYLNHALVMVRLWEGDVNMRMLEEGRLGY